MTAPPDLSALRFTASFSVTPSFLEIDYDVENPTAHLVALFSRVPITQPDQSITLPVEGAYIETSDDRLIVRKDILRLPPGMRAAELSLPYAVRLEPHGRFHEEFRLPVPVAVHQPFLQAILGGEHPGLNVLPVVPAVVSSITFELGALAIFGATRLVPISGYPGVFRVTPPIPEAPARTTFTASGSLQPPVPVLLYRAIGPP